MEKYILKKMAEIKSEIQDINIYIDSARTDETARRRYRRYKDRLKELVEEHKGYSEGGVENIKNLKITI